MDNKLTIESSGLSIREKQRIDKILEDEVYVKYIKKQLLKKNKKFKSMQDILDFWVNKGAMLDKSFAGFTMPWVRIISAHRIKGDDSLYTRKSDFCVGLRYIDGVCREYSLRDLVNSPDWNFSYIVSKYILSEVYKQEFSKYSENIMRRYILSKIERVRGYVSKLNSEKQIVDYLLLEMNG